MTGLPPSDPLRALQAPAPVDVVLDAGPHAPRQARRVLAALDGSPLDPGRMEDVRVAASEAVANAALHAYGDEPGPVRLKAWPCKDALAVLVADRGRGFDPGSAIRGRRTGLGAGVRIMRALASELGVASRPGAGAAVLMVFRPAG